MDKLDPIVMYAVIMVMTAFLGGGLPILKSTARAEGLLDGINSHLRPTPAFKLETQLWFNLERGWAPFGLFVQYSAH